MNSGCPTYPGLAAELGGEVHEEKHRCTWSKSI
jgi:hypothetical protein